MKKIGFMNDASNVIIMLVFVFVVANRVTLKHKNHMVNGGSITRVQNK